MFCGVVLIFHCCLSRVDTPMIKVASHVDHEKRITWFSMHACTMSFCSYSRHCALLSDTNYMYFNLSTTCCMLLINQLCIFNTSGKDTRVSGNMAILSISGYVRLSVTLILLKTCNLIIIIFYVITL